MINLIDQRDAYSIFKTLGILPDDKTSFDAYPIVNDISVFYVFNVDVHAGVYVKVHTDQLPQSP